MVYVLLFFFVVGYGKLLDYELLIIDYFVDLVRSKGKKFGLGGFIFDFEECFSVF